MLNVKAGHAVLMLDLSSDPLLCDLIFPDTHMCRMEMERNYFFPFEWPLFSSLNKGDCMGSRTWGNVPFQMLHAVEVHHKTN